MFAGEVVTVQKDVVRLPDGGTATREVVRHPGAVAVLPLLSADVALLEWQYRYAPGRHFWEFPAGKLEAGEDPLAAAKRELLEETGYAAGRWEFAADVDVCVGYGDERMRMFLAQDLEYRGHPGEDDEFVRTVAVPLERAAGMMRDGEITDAKTLIGVMWLLLRGRGG